MPLHVNYRPKNLDEFVGGESIKDGIKSVLEREDRPHAFLFSGTYGCGKTTLGRIVRNMLGCSPVEYKEINGADASGIDTIRRLKTISRYAPMEGPVKVFLIDEAHGCTGKAKDALLDELESPPPHVFYILCTNQPEKLSLAIKSRCTEFKVNPLNTIETKRLINWVLEEEGTSLPKGVMEGIMKASQGIPRQAVKILDAVIDIEDEDTALEVIGGYGSVGEEEVLELCRALSYKARSWDEVAKILQKLSNKDPEQLRQTVLGYFKATLLKGKNSETIGVKMAEFLDVGYGNGMPGFVYACWASFQIRSN